MNWFYELFGAQEPKTLEGINQLIKVDEHNELIFLTSTVNQRRYQAGRLEIPTLTSLRERFAQVSFNHDRTTLCETIANVQNLHLLEENAGAMFQVASQVNLLEMASPQATPKDGVTIYQYDRTQGPACAIAAGAGTVYRNYFYPTDQGKGQIVGQQINTLNDFHSALSSEKELWDTQNGYILPNQAQLQRVFNILSNIDERKRESLKGQCKIGFQWNTEVTLNSHGQLVNQAYCSALPLGYSRLSTHLWEPLARLVLEAAYESILLAAAINADQGGSSKVYLTTIGGGVFSNPEPWIYGAIRRGLKMVEYCGLDVIMVSYGSKKVATQELVTAWSRD